MPAKVNRVGQKFGKLTILEQLYENGKSLCVCKCDCGITTKKIELGSVVSGNTKSCGCLVKETLTERNKKLSKHQGLAQDKLYWAWNHMIQRCDKDYENNKRFYKDRGIKVCEEWYDFLVFREWSLNNGFSENLSLDRIDNNGNYEPSNCRWATKEQQSNNTRATKLIEYKGEIKSISQWARIFGISRKTISYRLDNGWSKDDLFIKSYEIYTRRKQ